MSIYEDDRDRERFLLTLEQVVERFNWLCHAYCLMENHYHLVVETVDGNLSLGMRHLNGVYTQSYNRRHNRGGHVFQGRFKSILVDRDAYLLALCRYVVLNPVRAKRVKNPGQYRWSSYRGTAGLTKRPSFLTIDWILGEFGKKRGEAQKRYNQFVSAGLEEPSPWDQLMAQCILGGRDFIEKVRPAVKESSDLTEIPKLQRMALRPPLDELLGSVTGIGKTDRDRAIQRAHLEHGYTLTEIARYLGLHYTTISKIINQKTS
jgi:putative transposase